MPEWMAIEQFAIRPQVGGCTGTTTFCFSPLSALRARMTGCVPGSRCARKDRRIVRSAKAFVRRCRRALISPSFKRRSACSDGFSFLFDDTRKLFSIGFRVADGSLDQAAMTCLLPERVWQVYCHRERRAAFARMVFIWAVRAPVDRGSALISWSGSIFEYLMPALVMRSPERSLLNQTDDAGQCEGKRRCRNPPTMRAISTSTINIQLAVRIKPRSDSVSSRTIPRLRW